jgi:hypothetical protein
MLKKQTPASRCRDSACRVPDCQKFEDISLCDILQFAKGFLSHAVVALA